MFNQLSAQLLTFQSFSLKKKALIQLRQPWKVREVESLSSTSFSAQLKECEGRRKARGKINVLLRRPANIPTSLPPLTSGNDQGRQRKREAVVYWLASCSSPDVDTEVSHYKFPDQQNKMKQYCVSFHVSQMFTLYRPLHNPIICLVIKKRG